MTLPRIAGSGKVIRRNPPGRSEGSGSVPQQRQKKSGLWVTFHRAEDQIDSRSGPLMITALSVTLLGQVPRATLFFRAGE